MKSPLLRAGLWVNRWSTWMILQSMNLWPKCPEIRLSTPTTICFRVLTTMKVVARSIDVQERNARVTHKRDIVWCVCGLRHSPLPHRALRNCSKDIIRTDCGECRVLVERSGSPLTITNLSNARYWSWNWSKTSDWCLSSE